MFRTKQGMQSVCISIKNHDTHTETSNLSTRLWHYMAKSSFSKVIHRIQTCSYIAMPNRNYTTVCILSSCNIVICSLSFREHCTIISAPCLAADTCGFLYRNSPIKVLPYLLPYTCRTWGNSRGFDLL